MLNAPKTTLNHCNISWDYTACTVTILTASVRSKKLLAEQKSCVIVAISYTYTHLLTLTCWFLKDQKSTYCQPDTEIQVCLRETSLF
jgi:hypothetical protein